MRALLKELESKARELRKGRVVFDMRGNGGGNSRWGNQVAAAVRGPEPVTALLRSFDLSHDWRASPDNLASLR